MTAGRPQRRRHRPRRFLPALALLLAAPPVASASAAKGAGDSLTGAADRDVDRRVFESNLKGARLFYNDRFDEALRAFKRSIKIDPEGPTGHVLAASAYQSMMHEYRNRKYLKQMKKHLDRGIALAEKRISRGEELGRSYQFLGAAYGNLGLYHALQDNWFRAFRAGQKLQDALEEALRQRPDIADADFGYGFFLYWRTIKASIFKWLAGGDQRKAGIKRLRRATREGELCADLARQSLVRIYFQEKRYDDVHAVAAELLSAYPAGITPLWWQGQAYVAQKNWAATKKVHEGILERLKKKRFHSTEALVESRYFIALAEARTGAKDSALDHLKWILSQESKVDDDIWLGPDYIDMAEELLESL